MYIEDLTTRSTVTEIQIAINKAVQLYNKLVGWLYKSMLYDEIGELCEWKDIRIKLCSEDELNRYHTFVKYGII